MLRPYPGFIGGSDTPQSPIANDERTVNWFLERSTSQGATTPAALYPVPGVTALEDEQGAASPGRSLFAQAGRCFGVFGGFFEEIVINVGHMVSVTSRGAVALDAFPASICANGDAGDQLLITSGDVAYSYNLTSNVLTVERASGNRMGGMLDGYGLALDAATSTLFISDLNDLTTWDPTQFAQRSIASDPWEALIVSKATRSFLLLGQETSEWWYNAGIFPFPFLPRPDGLLPYGIAAPFSAEDVGGTIVWLTRTSNGQGRVAQAAGSTVQIISTPAVDWAIAQYATIDDAIGDTFEVDGHAFYLLTFPTAKASWLYHLNTGTWTEAGTWMSAEMEYHAWRPLYHAHFAGLNICLDRSGAVVYHLSTLVSTDVEGLPIRRLRRPPTLFANGEPIFLSALRLFFEPGLGLGAGQGSQPLVAMRLSKDGGKTWGAERTRNVGPQGAYQTRVEFLRCGSGERLVPEVVVSDGIPWRLIGAAIDVVG
jgi:hypothetical protein